MKKGDPLLGQITHTCFFLLSPQIPDKQSRRRKIAPPLKIGGSWHDVLSGTGAMSTNLLFFVTHPPHSCCMDNNGTITEGKLTSVPHPLYFSIFISHSMPSVNPLPCLAEQAWICHGLSRMATKLSSSAISSADMAPTRSCLLANTMSGTPFIFSSCTILYKSQIIIVCFH